MPLRSLSIAEKRQRTIFNVILVCLPFVVIGSQGARAESVYLLRQNNVITGPHLVYVCKRGVRITNMGTKVVLVSTAPDWKIYLFNTDVGKYIVVDPDKFKGCFATPLMALRGDNYNKVTWKRIDSKRLDGILADRWNASGKKPDKRIVQGLQEYTGITQANYTVFHDQIVPGKVADAISRFYAIPPLHKVPLILDYARKRNDYRPGLTLEYAKTIEFKPDLFAQPKGLKLAKTESEVITDLGELLTP